MLDAWSSDALINNKNRQNQTHTCDTERNRSRVDPKEGLSKKRTPKFKGKTKRLKCPMFEMSQIYRLRRHTILTDAVKPIDVQFIAFSDIFPSNFHCSCH